MIKVPAYQCSFMHKTTTCVKNVGKHEIPILRAHARKMGGGDLVVERPAGGQSPEMYWITFESVDAEYSRLRNPDGMYAPQKYGGEDIVDRIYPTLEDMAEVIDEELVKLARNEGRSQNVPAEIKAPQDLMDLVVKAFGKDHVFDKDESPEKLALALVQVGITNVPEVAAASMNKLCSAKLVGPVAAAKLKDAATEQEAIGEDQDRKKGLIEGLGVFDPAAPAKEPAGVATLLDE